MMWEISQCENRFIAFEVRIKKNQSYVQNLKYELKIIWGHFDKINNKKFNIVFQYIYYMLINWQINILYKKMFIVLY